MANNDNVQQQREIDILNHTQDLILTGTRCFETDDVDCNRLLIDLRRPPKCNAS